MMGEKKEKEAVDYTPHAAMKNERCELCSHFRPMYETCALVKGHIKPGAWCKLFERK